jgi:ABC-2 type transport system ATP-binding protein
VLALVNGINGRKALRQDNERSRCMTESTESTVVVDRVTKRYGAITAVEELSFDAKAGRVTGFLGPNGAGKTTTLRMLLGLVTPTSGSATLLRQRYDELESPVATVGALLDADTFHPWRSARNHLRITAAAAGLNAARVDAVLEEVGLGDVARRRVGSFSLGMRQRLGLARALLGEPGVLVLDEPANGLDPDGIRWLRTFLRDYAARGRTVLVSSHNLAEVEQTVDDVVIIAKGRLRAHCTLAELRERSTGTVEVTTKHAEELRVRLAALPIDVVADGSDRLQVIGTTAEAVGEIAARGGIALSGIQTTGAGLESLFFELTDSTRDPRVDA